MPTDENQRKVFDFLLERFRTQEPFGKEQLRDVTSWNEASFKTYWSKQFESFLVGVLFVQSIVQVVNGEDEIWMIEGGMRNRLHIWRVEQQ
jgi:hypothetical protein